MTNKINLLDMMYLASSHYYIFSLFKPSILLWDLGKTVEPDQMPKTRRLIRYRTVCLQNVLIKFE